MKTLFSWTWLTSLLYACSSIAIQPSKSASQGCEFPATVIKNVLSENYYNKCKEVTSATITGDYVGSNELLCFALKLFSDRLCVLNASNSEIGVITGKLNSGLCENLQDMKLDDPNEIANESVSLYNLLFQNKLSCENACFDVKHHVNPLCNAIFLSSYLSRVNYRTVTAKVAVPRPAAVEAVSNNVVPKEAAVEAESKAAVEAESKAAVEAESKAAVEAESKAAVEAESKAAVEAESKAAIEAESKAAIEAGNNNVVLKKVAVVAGSSNGIQTSSLQKKLPAETAEAHVNNKVNLQKVKTSDMKNSPVTNSIDTQSIQHVNTPHKDQNMKTKKDETENHNAEGNGSSKKFNKANEEAVESSGKNENIGLKPLGKNVKSSAGKVVPVENESSVAAPQSSADRNSGSAQGHKSQEEGSQAINIMTSTETQNSLDRNRDNVVLTTKHKSQEETSKIAGNEKPQAVNSETVIQENHSSPQVTDTGGESKGMNNNQKSGSEAIESPGNNKNVPDEKSNTNIAEQTANKDAQKMDAAENEDTDDGNLTAMELQKTASESVADGTGDGVPESDIHVSVDGGESNYITDLANGDGTGVGDDRTASDDFNIGKNVEETGMPLLHDRFEAEDSHFFAYFMTTMVFCIVGYLVFHNKQKILALALEGRARRGRRRPNTSGYRKLDSNLEEAISSSKSASVTQVIY